jgi:N-acetylmuramic acid 6-phosphate etherase
MRSRVAAAARERGAKVVALANNPDAPLFQLADVAILLATPPEVIAGSTRMGAGTAQKIAFNMLSTMLGIHLGHVHDGHMVNLKADNAKLKSRAARMIGDIAAVSPDEAGRLLEASGGSVKAAILIAGGAADAAVAVRLLQANDNNLRRALAALKA